MVPVTIQAVVTDDSGHFKKCDPIAFGENSDTTSHDTIEIDAKKEYQKILGFGAAFTDASCYMISRLADAPRKALLQELLSSQGIALSVCRTSVGQSDYGRVLYSYDDTPDDMELKHFSLDYDLLYIIPTLKEARQVNSDLYLFSSPWSPPGWMKTTESMMGGWMREKYLEVFARYYLRYLQGYAQHGIKIDALTPQNEVETDQRRSMAACYWHPEYEMAFVRDHLGPLLRKNGLDTKIWILDHNYVYWQRPIWMLNDPGVKEYTNGVAFHGYLGTVDMMKRVQEAHPDIDIFWTEGGPRITDPGYKTDWCRWGKSISEVLENGSRSYTGWNMALDEEGKPNVGPYVCGGLVTINSKTLEVTRSGQFYAMGHFSKFVKRDAVRIQSDSPIEVIDQTAYRNPDGSFVLVVVNPGNTRAIQLRSGKRQAELPLAYNSVTTFTWSD